MANNNKDLHKAKRNRKDEFYTQLTDIERELKHDHIDPWHEGGKTTEENCQLLCKKDNRRKSGK